MENRIAIGAPADVAPADTQRYRLFPVVYGLMHAAVDASCVMALFSTVFVHDLSPFNTFYLIIAYDVMAFAGQAFFGLLIDKLRFSRGAVLTGIVLSAAAVLLLKVEPYAAVICAGIGNALFHVGAGSLSLFVQRGRATPPGIFVAPGALGLALGIYLGKGHFLIAWPLLLALTVAFAVALFYDNPPIPVVAKPRPLEVPWPFLAFGLLLFSVTMRALVGSAGSYDCPKALEVSFGLAAAAFAGKALGGILADRLGWIESSVGALLLSAPLIAFGGDNSLLVISGMFFFQMTMPVTLVAVASILPGRPAFAFGMTCLALVAGAVPTFFRAVKNFYHPALFLTLILLAAAAIFFGLRLLRPAVPMKFAASREAPQPKA